MFSFAAVSAAIYQFTFLIASQAIVIMGDFDPYLPGNGERRPPGSGAVTNLIQWSVAWVLLIGIGLSVLWLVVMVAWAAISKRVELRDAKKPFVSLLLLSSISALLQLTFQIFNGAINAAV